MQHCPAPLAAPAPARKLCSPHSLPMDRPHKPQEPSQATLMLSQLPQCMPPQPQPSSCRLQQTAAGQLSSQRQSSRLRCRNVTQAVQTGRAVQPCRHLPLQNWEDPSQSSQRCPHLVQQAWLMLLRQAVLTACRVPPLAHHPLSQLRRPSPVGWTMLKVAPSAVSNSA